MPFACLFCTSLAADSNAALLNKVTLVLVLNACLAAMYRYEKCYHVSQCILHVECICIFVRERRSAGTLSLPIEAAVAIAAGEERV